MTLESYLPSLSISFLVCKMGCITYEGFLGINALSYLQQCLTNNKHMINASYNYLQESCLRERWEVD